MAGKIIINTERCKGCGLCITVCPKKSIVISTQSNSTGYFPAKANNNDCSGCAACAIMCPDAVIEVLRDSKIIAVESVKKSKPTLVKKK